VPSSVIASTIIGGAMLPHAAVAPAFTVHVGSSARGSFAGRQFHWRVPGETSFEIVRKLYRQGFDPAFTSTAKIDYAIGIPLTHLGVEDPVSNSPDETLRNRLASGSSFSLILILLGG
jgi:hypothetical protein